MEGTFLERIVSQSETFSLPKPFQFVRTSQNVRRLSGDTVDIVRTLEAEFGAEQLETSRVFVRDANGQPKLSPVLDSSPWMVLRREKGGPPIELVNQNGRLTTSEPPVLRCTEDHITRARAAKHKFVLAASSGDDLALLRMLNLPVMPACGLSTITAKQGQYLFADGEQPVGVAKSSHEVINLPHERPKIILVAADLCALRNQFPNGFLPTAKQVRRIERVLKRKTNVGIWLPGVADFQSFDDGVELADPQLVSDAITSSVQRSTKSIDEFFASTSVSRAMMCYGHGKSY